MILNDYMHADLDAQRIADEVLPGSVMGLTGSCICCDGINELRDSVNKIPARSMGITLIEANGTTDASTLMGFLGVGLAERFSPPVQITVVDSRNWQQRGFNNELEAEQTKVASLVLLSHLEEITNSRKTEVEREVRKINPHATIVTRDELDALLIPELNPAEIVNGSLDHHSTHWSSCSIDLPDLPDLQSIKLICDLIPPSILRIKGCTKIGNDKDYTYFERCPDGRVYVGPYTGTPVTGPRLLTVGPGSEPLLLYDAVTKSLEMMKGSSINQASA